MTDIFEPIGSAVAGFLGSSGVQLTLRLLVLYAVIVWIATAWWAFQDASRRTTSLPAPFLASGLVVLATPLFFLPIAIVYRLIRPAETLAEATERDLTEVSLEATVARLSCRNCDAAIEADWRLCPFCRYELLVPCPKCSQSVDAAWSICPWCVADLPWAREPVGVFAEPVGVFTERANPRDAPAPAWPSWEAPVAEPPIVWPADWEARVAAQSTSTSRAGAGHARTAVADDERSKHELGPGSRPATRM